MSTYKFKVSKPEDIDIPRICRENADQDAFVILFDDKILYAAKKELRLSTEDTPNCDCGGLNRKYLRSWGTKPLTPIEEFCGFTFGWDYTNNPDSPLAYLQTAFFKKVADSRAEINRKKQEEEKAKARKILVTVIAKD